MYKRQVLDGDPAAREGNGVRERNREGRKGIGRKGEGREGRREGSGRREKARGKEGNFRPQPSPLFTMLKHFYTKVRFANHYL